MEWLFCCSLAFYCMLWFERNKSLIVSYTLLGSWRIVLQFIVITIFYIEITIIAFSCHVEWKQVDWFVDFTTHLWINSTHSIYLVMLISSSLFKIPLQSNYPTKNRLLHQRNSPLLRKPFLISMNPRSGMHSWLQDPFQRDQFLIRYKDQVEVYWRDSTSPQLVHDGKSDLYCSQTLM